MRLREEGMAALVALNDGILAHVPRDRPVVFLDYPVYNNVGDLLIMLGTRAFIRRHGLGLGMAAHHGNLPPRARAGIPKGATILMQGGGNFGDLHPNHQPFRERVLGEYPDHKVVVLPQTLHWRDPDGMARFAATHGRHQDFTLLVRDRPSLELGRRHLGEGRVHLFPDMAHQLWPELHDDPARRPPTAASTLLFIRDDAESGAVPDLLKARAARFVDWQQVVPPSLRLQSRAFTALARVEAGLGRNLGLAEPYFRQARARVGEIVARLDPHDLWVTSRLHTMILGFLLGKPLVVVDNSYGKLGGYLEAFGQHLRPTTLLGAGPPPAGLEALLDVAPGADLAQRRTAALALG